MLLPKWVTENDREAGRTAARLFLAALKGATENRVDAENVEELARDFFGTHALRGALAGKRKILQAINGEVFKAFVLGPEIEKIGIANRIEAGFIWWPVLERAPGDELLWLREREWLEKDGVDDAEDGGIRADPDRQCEDSDDCKPRFLEKLSDGKTELGKHGYSDLKVTMGSTPAARRAGIQHAKIAARARRRLTPR